LAEIVATVVSGSAIEFANDAAAAVALGLDLVRLVSANWFACIPPPQRPPIGGKEEGAFSPSKFLLIGELKFRRSNQTLVDLSDVVCQSRSVEAFPRALLSSFAKSFAQVDIADEFQQVGGKRLGISHRREQSRHSVHDYLRSASVVERDYGQPNRHRFYKD
jgi:hypothetical protein